MRVKCTQLFYVASLLVTLLIGCSAGDGDSRADYPAPGELQLVSVVPLNQLGQKNLIPEQTFEEWYAGAERPSSSVILLPLNTSKIERDMKDPAVGRVCVKQVWNAKDNIWRPDDLFGLEIENLEPNSRYRLTLRAKTLHKSQAGVQVYGIREGTPLWQLKVKNWIVIESGDGWREFTGDFDTGELTTVRLTTAFEGEFSPTEPNTILWDDWRLKRVGDSPSDQATQQGLIANGGFTAWRPGKRAPDGFIAPDDSVGHSDVFPMQLTDGDGDGHSVQQEWLAPDGKDDPKTRFGCQVDVEPNKDYIFKLNGRDRGVSILVGVYGIDESGNLQAIEEQLLTLEPTGRWQQYEARFNTAQYKSIRILTHLDDSATHFPCYYISDAWELRPFG